MAENDKEIRSLIKSFKTKDREKQTNIAKEIAARYGPNAIPTLAEAVLRSKNSQRQLGLVDTLELLTSKLPSYPKAILGLVRLENSKDLEVSAAAKILLDRLKEEASTEPVVMAFRAVIGEINDKTSLEWMAHTEEATAFQHLKIVREAQLDSRSQIRVGIGLGRLKLTAAIDELLELVHSSDSQVQNTGLAQLVSFNDPRIVKTLLPTLGKLKGEALEHTIQAITAQGLSKEILDALEDSNRHTRLRTVEITRRIADSTAISHLLPLLADKKSEIRRTVIITLGQLSVGQPEVTRLIGRRLRDPELEVRKEATNTLNHLVDISAAPFLVLAEEEEENEAIKGLVSVALASLENKAPERIQALRGLYSTENSINAEQALIENGDAVLPDVVVLLSAVNYHIRKSALRIFSALENSTVVPEICYSLKDEVIEIRKEAISTLVAIGSEDATDSLLEALNDQQIHDEAVDALVKIGKVNRIQNAATQGNSELIQAGACRVLGLRKELNSVSILESFLKHASSLVREKAAEALGAIGDSNSANSLALVLNDKDPDVRVAVLRAAGQLGQEASILPILKQSSIERESPVLKAIFSALIEIGKILNINELMEALTTLLSSTEEEWHSTKGTLGEQGDAFPYLLQLAVESPGSYMRQRAAEALGSAEEPFKNQAVEVLQKALNDSTAEVQLAAVKSLGILKDPSSLDSLINALQIDYLWDEAVSSLILIGETAPLLKPLEASEHVTIRLGICRVLSALTPADGVPVLTTRLQDPEKIIRLASLDALAKIGNPEPVPAIIAILKSRDKKEKEKASEALGYLGDPRSIPHLLDAEEDRSREVRDAATEALRKLGEALDLEKLIIAMRQLRSSDPTLQEKGVDTLPTFSEEETVPLLMDWLQSPNSFARAGNLLVLGRINWPKTPEQPIIGMLQDDNSEVRRAALQALDNLGTVDSFLPVLKCLEERDRKIWSCAIQTAVAIRRRNPKVHSEILSRLQNENEAVRKGVVIIIREIETREDAHKVLPLSSDLSEGVRIEAIRTLGVLGDISVVSALLQQIGVSKPKIRKTVVEALGSLEDMRGTVPLLERAALDEDRDIQKAAEQALRQIGQPSGHQDMLGFLISLKSSDKEIRDDAIAQLASLEDSFPFLEQLLHSGSSQVRAGAAQAIGRLAHDRRDITDQLIKLLEDLSLDVRLGAIDGLGAMGDPHAVVPIVNRLHEKNQEIWEQSINTLVQIGATSPLLPFLEDLNPRVREGIVNAFGIIKESSTLPHLTALLHDQNTDVRAATAVAIGELGLTDGTEPLLKALQERDQTVRIKMIEAIGKIADSKAIFELLEQEEESNRQIAEAAFQALSKIAKHNQMPTVHSLESLRSENTAKRQQAIEELVEWGNQGAPWVTQALDSRNSQIRAGAIQVLSTIVYDAAVEKIAEALRDSSSEVRNQAAQSMGIFCFQPAAVPLIQLLADKSEEVRGSSISALVQIGLSTVPHLLTAIEDKNQTARKGVCEVLGLIADPSASEKLSQRLSDKTEVRRAAIEALKRIGPPCIPYLVTTTKGKDAKARSGAVEAAGYIGKEMNDIQAIRLLEAVLNDKKEEVREEAAKGLLEIGLPSVQSLCRALISHNTDTALKSAQTLRDLTDVMIQAEDLSATRNLIGALNHKSADVRAVAAEALGQLGDAKAAVMPLLKKLNDKKANVRLAVVESLALLKDGRAIEPLERMLNDKETNVRTAAVDALAKLQDAQVKRVELEGMEVEEIFQKQRRLSGLVKRAQEIAAQEGVEETDLVQLKDQVMQTTEELLEESRQPDDPEKVKQLQDQKIELEKATDDFRERIRALEDEWADGKISDEEYDQKEARLRKILTRREEDLKKVEEDLKSIT
ncbi:MAG: HEAT repeat domain-containing protein [Candidatus Heimdallarchaeota archaeon]